MLRFPVCTQTDEGCRTEERDEATFLPGEGSREYQCSAWRGSLAAGGAADGASRLTGGSLWTKVFREGSGTVHGPVLQTETASLSPPLSFSLSPFLQLCTGTSEGSSFPLRLQLFETD